jgi:IS30 family transposase
MKSYHQLTYEQRCQIYALKKSKTSQKVIAEIIGCSQPTVSRELKHNTGKRGFRPKQAQEKSDARRRTARKAIKMTVEVMTIIESKLRILWSPEQISGWLLSEENIAISHERIYQHVWQNKGAGGDLYRCLRRQGKARQSRAKSQAGRGHIKNRVGIEERPSIVDERSRVGDWEIDLVIGKGHSGALITLVERQTSYTLSSRINDKSAATVTAGTIALLAPFKKAVHTITADNGKEFAYHEQISKALDAKVFFADPYSSWQRGLNENTNGLLRQYWPKSTDFKQVPNTQVSSVITQLNNRPRKKLNYQTPAKLMAEYMTALAA